MPYGPLFVETPPDRFPAPAALMEFRALT